MRIIKIKNNVIKFMGINILKLKQKGNYTVYYFCGLRIWKRVSLLNKIVNEFRDTKSFNVQDYDAQISNVVKNYSVAKYKTKTQDSKKIGFLATILYDMGGHSKWMRDMQITLSSKYQQKAFIVDQYQTSKYAQNTLNEIQKVSQIKMFNSSAIYANKTKIIRIYNEIIEFAPMALFVFIHPDDVIGAAVLSLIKMYTDIKIYYVNHATHRPNLGMSFSDLILEETHSTAYITQKLRELKQTHIVGLISKRKQDNPLYTKKQIKDARKNLGIPNNCFCTMSGASSYKFFTENDSLYFRMIKDLLEKQPNLFHVVVTEMSNQQKAIINNIFANSDLLSRLIIIPFQEDYELIFSCADLFIDSFPMSSALTFIDLMRLRVPYVVKINEENSALTFHEYQDPKFPYMYKTIDQMLKGIIDLVKNDNKRMEMTIKNYDFYLNKYEPKSALKILQSVIKCKNYKDLYDQINPKIKYNFVDEIFK